MVEWARRLPLPAALAAAALLSVGQVELLLKQFQQTGTQAYGVTALGGGIWPHPADAGTAVTLWNGREKASQADAAAFLWGYTLADFALIAALVWLAWAAAVRVAASYPQGETAAGGVLDWNRRPLWANGGHAWVTRLRPLVYFAVLDVAEDLVRVLNFYAGGREPLYWVGYTLEKAKLLALLLVVAALVVGVRHVVATVVEEDGLRQWRLRGPIDDPNSPQRVLREARRALATLRGEVGLVLVFSLLLLVDATGQVSDFFRRWTDLVSALLGLLGLLVFAFVLWSSGRRTALADQGIPSNEEPRQVRTRGLLLAGGVTLVLAVLARLVFGSFTAFSLPVVIGALCLLQGFAAVASWEDVSGTANQQYAEQVTREALEAPTGRRRHELRRLGRFLAAFPVCLVGIVLVKAGAAPLVLASRPDGYGAGSALWLLLLGLLVIAVGSALLPRLLRSWDEDEPRALEKRHVVATGLVVVMAALIVASPLTVPPVIGSLGVVTIACSAVCLVFAELQRFSEGFVPQRGLVMLGFQRTPVFVLLAAWFAVASTLNTSGQHDIRTTAGTREPVALTQVWDEWLEQNCVASSTGPVPLVFVIAQGGGIRAAYWTGSVLTELLSETTGDQAPSDPNPGCVTASPRSHVFALSGISGGSVGAASYFAQESPGDRWYEEALGAPDYSAVALGRGLFVDLPRGVVGFHGEDRAGLLERAWEEKNPALGKDYFIALKPGRTSDGTWMPVTMFNGAQAETGCRLNTSPVRLTPPRQELEKVVDCRAIVGRTRTLTLAGEDGGQSILVPAAPVTVDSVAVAQSCSDPKSFRVSTAALMSARWPYISPSGRIPCGPPWVSAIDGGYADPAGYAAFRDLWTQLTPLVAEQNRAARGDAGLVVPVLVVIDNHYQSSAKAADPGRTPELLVPPYGEQRAQKTRGPDREQAAMSLVAGTPPGSVLRCDVPAYDPDGSGGEPDVGRVLLAPTTRPGLPAPLAWTLASSSRQDLDDQRGDLFEAGAVGDLLREMLNGSGSPVTCRS